MFNLSYSTPAPIKGIIWMKERLTRTGNITDVDGNEWNVHSLMGDEHVTFVSAVPIGGLHPFYQDTSGQSYGYVSQTWEPYQVMVKPEEKNG